MKLPEPETLSLNWKTSALEGWCHLVREVRRLGAQAGKGDLFQKITAELLQMSRSGDLHRLPELLKKRVTARALTQLSLENADFRRRMMSKKVLESLVTMQQPRLGIMPLHALISLYFREFDHLDQQEEGLRAELEQVIRAQLDVRLKGQRHQPTRDLLTVLQGEAPWLLSSDGPKRLVDHVRAENRELAAAFVDFELQGLDSGRYADICRAHYYLETLKHIPVGKNDEVFSELLKPSVCKAPYLGQKRIGHVALEILIDRAQGDPGECWQNFIMDLAGDPRIASSAANYREWWKPIGEDRIEKVRSWLAKEDLRLFLKALEQYSLESGKADLQRMYPARKRFLEGLDKLKLVHRTRLMLGRDAETAIRKILGSELKTSYVKLSMPDKAVIYIDCGEFCLIEGSHSFKLWIYLAPPSEKVYSYDVKVLSHQDLTINVPASYRKKYGENAPYLGITHHPTTWQYRVFEFLAEHGISLDMETLLEQREYDYYLARFGMPVVSQSKTVLSVKESMDYKVGRKFLDNEGEHLYKKNIRVPGDSYGFSKLALGILQYLHYRGGSDSQGIADFLKITKKDVASTIYRELASYCVQDNKFRWKLSDKAADELREKGLIQ